MSKAVAYIRYSCEKQSDGTSLEAQQDKCEAFASLKDVELVSVFADEAKSGRSLNRRDGLQDALSCLGQNGVDTLICYSISRLTRSMSDLCNLVDAYFGPKGFKLVCVQESIDTTTAAGRLVLHMLGAVMASEVEQLSERVKASIEVRRKHNQKISRHAPFGYRKSNRTGKLVPNIKERRTFEVAKLLSSDGHSAREIAEILAGRRVRNRSGRPYQRQSIIQMLNREPSWAS